MVQGQYTTNNRSAASGTATFAERDPFAKQAGFRALQRKCSSQSSTDTSSMSCSSGQPKAPADRCAGTDSTNVWGRFQNVGDFKSLHNY